MYTHRQQRQVVTAACKQNEPLGYPVDDPKPKANEAMLCLVTAQYLATLRDGLVEVSQILQDKLFEMDSKEKRNADDTARKVLKAFK